MTISASYDDLMRQAPMTVDLYLREAVKMVRDQLGEDAVAANGHLLGTLVTAMGQDFTAAVLSKTISEVAQMIEYKDFGGG